MCPQKFLFYCEKFFFAHQNPRQYQKPNISKISHPNSTNKVSNESLLLQLLILRKNVWTFLKNLKNSLKNVFFWHWIFLKNFVFCQRICSFLTNEVSNKVIRYPLSILAEKIPIFFYESQLWWKWKKKIEKPSCRGTYAQFFMKLRT